jgi:hypothetical protein
MMEKVVVVDLDLAAKIYLLYRAHFGYGKDPDLVTCLDCADYELESCFGGADDVMDCMAHKARYGS